VAWAPWDERLSPSAVKAMCQASRDAVRAERHAERDFEDAAAARHRGSWDQSLPMAIAGELPSWRDAERERWGRSSAELIAASRARTVATDLALDAASDLSEMLAEAVYLKDDASVVALDKCRGDIDRESKAFEVGAAP
jgi:hypothetical protein